MARSAGTVAKTENRTWSGSRARRRLLLTAGAAMVLLLTLVLHRDHLALFASISAGLFLFAMVWISGL
jgi:hypothetical protein